jgi:long-chain fatty acid transport protein
MKKSLGIFSLILILSLPVLAQSGTKLIGFDASTIGRGGVSFGFFDNPDLMMTNPAGISFLNHSMIDANFSLMVPSLHFQNNLNDKDGKTNYFPMPDISYVADPNSDLTWGIGFFTQGGMGADFSLNHALFVDQNGNYVPQTYHSKLAVMQGGPSVSYKFTPSFSVGISAQLVYSMLEFQMPYSLSPSIMAGVVNPQTGMTFGQMFAAPPAQGGFGYTEVTAAANMKDLNAVSFTGKIGFAYQVNDKLSLGLTYSLPTQLTYKNGKATMDMTAQLNDAFGKAVMGYMFQNPSATQQEAQAAVMQQFSQMGIDLSKGAVDNYNLQVKLKLPQSLGFGVAYKATENLKMGLDIEWVNWKNAFDKMTINLSDGSNPNIKTMMGNNGSFEINFPMDWKDVVLVKIGGEYNVNTDLTVRAGFAYGNNPVPSSTIFPVFPAIVESHITVGAGYKLTDKLTVNAAYELGLNVKETASNPSIIANEYNQSTSQLGTNLFHVSFAWNL